AEVRAVVVGVDRTHVADREPQPLDLDRQADDLGYAALEAQRRVLPQGGLVLLEVAERGAHSVPSRTASNASATWPSRVSSWPSTRPIAVSTTQPPRLTWS